MSGLFSQDISLSGWFDNEFVFSGQFDPDISIWRFASGSLSEQSDLLASAGNGLTQCSFLASDANDLCVSTGAVSITGNLSATESPQGLPGAYWNGKYWANGYWAANYWTPNTAPNSVLVKASLSAIDAADALDGGGFWSSRYWAAHFWASVYWKPDAIPNVVLIGGALAVTEAADTVGSSGAVNVIASIAETESADSLIAMGTAAGGVVSGVSGSLASQEDDDALHATAIRASGGLPLGAVAWWPYAGQAPKRRAVATVSTVDGDDRVAVRVRTAAIAVSRLIESSDRSASISRSTSGASLVLTDVADRLRMRASVDWSGLIAQEDESLAFGEDDLLMSELMREAA